jgi:hypothetical protein
MLEVSGVARVSSFVSKKRMRTFLLILAIHALLFGFGFLIAGWMTLLLAEADEQAEFNKGYQDARRKGWVEGLRYFSRFRSNFSSTRRLSTNWKQRPDARKFIYAGAAFLAAAAMLGIPLGAYN